MINKETGLTDKQEAFCQEFNSNGFNATAAYKAVYECKNWREYSINIAASALCRNNKVAIRLKQLNEESKERSMVKREEVENKQNAIATAEVGDLYIMDNGVLRARTFDELTERGRKAVKAPKFNQLGEFIGWELDSSTNAAKLLGTWNDWESPANVNLNARSIVGAEMRIGYKKPEEE